jgi:hypothetical protein
VNGLEHTKLLKYFATSVIQECNDIQIIRLCQSDSNISKEEGMDYGKQ